MLNTYTYIAGGKIRFNAHKSFKNRTIDNYRLLHLESGRGSFTVKNIRFSIKPNQTYLLAPGMRKAVYEGDCPTAFDYVEFQSSTRLLQAPYLNCQLASPFKEALTQLIKCVIRENETALRLQLLKSAVRLALHDTSEYLIPDSRLRRAVEYVEENPDQPTTLAALSNIAGLSEPQLRRLFKTHLHTTPKKYLMKVRMDYARQLMHSEGLRINEIADLLEFSSPFQFSAQYRHIHGLSPSFDADEKKGGIIRRDAG